MQFNKQQEEVINTINGNISVIATAGSGKTTIFAYRGGELYGQSGIRN